MKFPHGVALLLLVSFVSAASASEPSYAVRYRSATNVYLDAGTAQGLGVGDRLRVVEGQKTVAELEVVYAAEHSASCKVISETRPVRAGDVVVPISRAGVAVPTKGEISPAPPAAPVPAVSATPSGAGARSYAAPWARLRGAASLGYYRSWDGSESALDFSETTARLDLGVYDIARQPLSFTLRLRSRRDNRALALSPRTPQSERNDRFYELALRYQPPSDRIGLEVGRIGIYRFVGIGYLDGGLARYRVLDDVQIGVFGGRVAEIESLGFGGTGKKYGGFVRLVPGASHASAGYDAALAYVREDADGDVSREYLSLESRFAGGSRFWLFERAELDLNRGWRESATGRSYQLSNLSFSANLRLSSAASAYATYDGRRNYRYYQNRSVPDEVFDDLLHQGVRAGISYTRAGGLGLAAGVGMSLKEQDPRHPELDLANAYSFNASLRHPRLFSSDLRFRLEGSGFSNGYTRGGLVTAGVGRDFRGGHALELSYGGLFYSVRQSELAAALPSSTSRSTQWLRLLGRAELGHRVHLQTDLEYGIGDDLQGPRAFLEVGYVF
jgi:hypothetical protein